MMRKIRGDPMHRYLRAVGFKKFIRKRDIRSLINLSVSDSSHSIVLGDEEERYEYFDKAFGKNFGLRIFGYYEDNGRFNTEYYFPYSENEIVSTTEYCNIERHSDRVSFGGIVEDNAMGVSLIFHLSNGIDFIHDQRMSADPIPVKGIALNGLCTEGKILLPLYKTDRQLEKIRTSEKKRDHLIRNARNGDESAMEKLAMADMNIFQNVSERLAHEDVYSIVDTCFMPYGLESDQYSIIGEILQMDRHVNTLTGEICWRFVLECNNLTLSVMINEDDLMGEPAVGRRFKGDIWLMGKILYDKKPLQ